MNDEMPERWKWHLDWEIEDHFRLLKIKRDEKYNNTSSEAEDPEELWEENAYSARFK